MEYKVGDIVYFAGPNTDEFDRPSDTPKSPLKVVRVGSPEMSFDYEVVSRSGNHFWVRSWEIEDNSSCGLS
jgi:hypothetical protein